jgi:hypothetical protein
MANGAEIVRTLYKSITSCSDHHTVDVIKLLHIETPVDDAIVRGANENKVVIVTGNPGDGKTHLIRRVGDQFPKSLWRDGGVQTDANEMEDEEIVKAVTAALEKRRGLILAINEGILLEICERQRARLPWAGDVADRVLHPFSYGPNADRSRSRVVILDLNLRNCLGPTVAGAALDRLLDLVEGAPAGAEGLLENAQRLRQPVVRERVLYLLGSIGQTGFHATMRELLGFLSYLLCGGEGGSAPAPHYAQNAFGGGQGALFDRVRELDPVRMPMPFLDDALWNCTDTPDDWTVSDPGEYREPGDRDAFVRRKRRSFFEHQQGRDIVRIDQQAIEREFARLRSSSQSPEQAAIRLINNFFKPGATSESLVLWVYHQYSVRPIRHIVSRQAVRAQDLRVVVPRLPDALGAAFPDYQPDHVVLHHKATGPGDGLIIDRRLVRMLLEGDRSMGLGTRNLEAQKKVAGFFDRLAKHAGDQPVVSILRLDSGVENQIGVDLDTKSFFIPGG